MIIAKAGKYGPEVTVEFPGDRRTVIGGVGNFTVGSAVSLMLLHAEVLDELRIFDVEKPHLRMMGGAGARDDAPTWGRSHHSRQANVRGRVPPRSRAGSVGRRLP